MTPDEFAEAYEKGWKRTVKFLISRGVVPDTAEEIAQDAWGKGWMRRTELLKFAAIVPWINTIALNIFRARIRRQPLNGDVPEQTVGSTATPESTDVSRVLRSCDAEERFLIEATAAGYTSEDLARIKGCKPSTIRVRLMRLRRRLTPRFRN
jgi:DNA-directed RNA polymerase specialized sigma24 family protein